MNANNFRSELIELLRYPRTLIGAGLDLEKCPHGGLYSDDDLRCIACEDAPECEWLYHNGEFAALSEKPDEAIFAALEYALLHVSALASTAGHDPATCDCSNCAWVRRVSAVLERGPTVTRA